MAHATVTGAGEPVGMSHNINSELVSQGKPKRPLDTVLMPSGNTKGTLMRQRHTGHIHLELNLFMSSTGTVETPPVMCWEFI